MTLEEKRNEARLIIKRNRAAQILASPENPVEAEKPVEVEGPEYDNPEWKNFPEYLSRSWDSVAQGGVDAFDTLMGNNYGEAIPFSFEQSDPTLRDERTLDARIMAIPTDIVPAVFNPVAEGIVNTAKYVTPDAAKPFIEYAADAAWNDPRVKVLRDIGTKAGEGLEQWKAADPGSFNLGEDAFNMMMMTARARPQLENQAQTQALQFVRENIAQTGRDPLRIKEIPKTSRQEKIQQKQQEVEDAAFVAATEANIAKKLRQGEEGTLGDLSQNQGVMNVEAGLQTQPKSVLPLGVKAQLRNEQIIDDVLEPLPQGLPVSAQQAANQTVASRQAQIDAGVKSRMTQAEQAEQSAFNAIDDAQDAAVFMAQATEQELGLAQSAAQAARNAVATESTVAEASTVLNKTLTAAKEKAKSAASKLYDESKNTVISTRAAMEAISKDIVETASKGVRAELKNNYSGITEKFLVDGQDIGSILLHLQKFKNKIDKRSRPGSNKRNDADLLAAKIYKAIKADLAQKSPPFRQANEAWKVMNDEFSGGKFGRAISGAEGEVFSAAAGGTRKAQGALLARRIKEANTPQAVEDLVGVVAAEARIGGIDKKFMLDYEDLLKAVPPSVKAKYVAVIEANAAVDSAAAASTSAAANVSTQAARGATESAKAVSARNNAVTSTKTAQKKAQQGLSKTVAAQYAADPAGMLNSILTSTDGVAKLTRLSQYMAGKGEEAAFKAQLREVVSPQIGVKKYSANQTTLKMAESMEKIKNRLLESGVITTKEAQSITAGLQKTASIELRKRAAKVILEAPKQHWFRALLPSFGAVGALSLLPGSHQLLMGGTVRRMLSGLIGKTTNKRVVSEVERFLVNPESYLNAIKTAETSAQAATNIKNAIMARAMIQDLKEQE